MQGRSLLSGEMFCCIRTIRRRASFEYVPCVRLWLKRSFIWNSYGLFRRQIYCFSVYRRHFFPV